MADDYAAPEADAHYTVFVRFPFNRPADFVDPPLVDWDDAKDRELWQILAATPRGSDIDWKDLAERFEVTLEFALQQAAFLYSQNLSQVKAQMRRAGRTSSLSGTPTGGASSASPTGGVKVGSLEGKRSPSALSIRPAGERPQRRSQEGSAPSTPTSALRPATISRNPSVSTITQSRLGRAGSRASGRGSFSRGQFSQYRETSHFKSSAARTSIDGKRDASPSAVEEESLSEQSSSSSSSESSAEAPLAARSHMFRRTSRFAAQARQTTSSDDDDTDGPAFLPPTTGEARSAGSSSQPLSVASSARPAAASVKGKERHDPGQPESRAGTTRIESMSEASSTTSDALPATGPGARATARVVAAHGALSPRRQAELAGLVKSPTRAKREGSEGSPSMGSSFSDLENASITQSALEEEAASFLNKGGSRMSNLSRAFGM